MEVLEKLSARKPLWLQGMKFAELFRWLSSSQQAVSRCSAGRRSAARRSDAGAAWLGVCLTQDASTCGDLFVKACKGGAIASMAPIARIIASWTRHRRRNESALIACVADGAGTSSLGSLGSRLTCEAIARLAMIRFEETQTLADLQPPEVVRWCERARRHIEGVAESRQREIRDFATTLCGRRIARRQSIFFQIGDGAIVAASRRWASSFGRNRASISIRLAF